MSNVFGTTLQPCETGVGGSTGATGKCDADPIHRVCVVNIREQKPGFSRATGQGDWSARRGRDANHCVCAGAYANYVAFTNVRPTLNCAATSAEAVKTLQRWNDRTHPGQGEAAREALLRTCLPQAHTKRQREHLRRLLEH